MVGLLLALIYLSFISLGLPDGVLGSAWPLISEQFGVPISNMGIVSMIISAGTVFSSLNSTKLIHKLGVHKVTAFSILTTAVSLFGFSSAPSFLVLCLWAVPYGLGAGSVDAALNNYVAVHFQSKHMSWLHCMWGVGATTGPYIMGMALTGGHSFREGYLLLFGIQAAISLAVLLSAPVWKAGTNSAPAAQQHKRTGSLKEILGIRGVKHIAFAFGCFCAIEHTTGMWASSYLVFVRGVAPEIAAGFSALFYMGITVGRGVCGFVAMKYNDKQMIRGGVLLMAVGIAVLFLPIGQVGAFVGLALIGLGSSPVYPCIIHATPHHFGTAHSQAIIGVEMASAHIGIMLVPALFGVLGRQISFAMYPVFIGGLLAVMCVMYERMLRKVDR